MCRPLEKLTIEGFKSIRSLREFRLSRGVNVLVGANGAGKSNFVDLFRMLRAMVDGGLQAFIAKSGKAAGFFFNGPQETRQVRAELRFGDNEYRFALEPTAANEVLVRSEMVIWHGDIGTSVDSGSGGSEASLKDWKDKKSPYGPYKGKHAYAYDAISSWIVYHFHDTSPTAPMRRDAGVRDFRELVPDAGNIAPFLLKMRTNSAAQYQRIRETVQLIAPFFDDFILEPQGERELVRLEWKQKGSGYPFQPWHLSDGTIRFICLATALLQPKPPSTIVIDEPELGLHPYALEILSALIHETALKTQLLISTQSPVLVDHFEPQDIIIVQREEGASVFKRLDQENLNAWLDEYSLGQLIRKNVVEAGPSHG